MTIRRSITPVLARPDSSSQTRLSVRKTSNDGINRLELSQERVKRVSAQKSATKDKVVVQHRQIKN